MVFVGVYKFRKVLGWMDGLVKFDEYEGWYRINSWFCKYGLIEEVVDYFWGYVLIIVLESCLIKFYRLFWCDWGCVWVGW